MGKNSDPTTKKIDITKCYGEKCDICPEECQWKEAGRSRLSDDRHSKNIANGSEPCYDFEEEFGSAFETQSNTPAGDMIRLFYWSLKVAPQGTMAILERAFEGKNQSDAARSRGVTRQAIAKIYKGDLLTLAHLLGIRRPNLPESRLWRLNAFEFQIMKMLRESPDITERTIARTLGRTQSAVHRAKCSALNKMNQNPPSKSTPKRINRNAQ